MEKCQKPRRAPNLDLKKARGSESLGDPFFGYYSRLFRHNGKQIKQFVENI
jgi:hypothetical protein